MDVDILERGLSCVSAKAQEETCKRLAESHLDGNS